MKVIINKEFDGNQYVGSCENLPGCYTQAASPEELMKKLHRAIELYRKSYSRRNQELPSTFDKPVIDKRIRFHIISSAQLSQVLTRYNYHLEFKDSQSLLFLNSHFPFNRIHIPNSSALSYLIISKLFGRENVIYINQENIRVHTAP